MSSEKINFLQLMIPCTVKLEDYDNEDTVRDKVAQACLEHVGTYHCIPYRWKGEQRHLTKEAYDSYIDNYDRCMEECYQHIHQKDDGDWVPF